MHLLGLHVFHRHRLSSYVLLLILTCLERVPSVRDHWRLVRPSRIRGHFLLTEQVVVMVQVLVSRLILVIMHYRV